MRSNATRVPDLRSAADALVDYMALTAGESAVITADTDTDAAAVAAVFQSVTALSASATVLTMSRLPFQGALADPYIPPAVGAAVGSCDVWIDLAFPYMAGSHVHDDATREGKARYLLGGDMGSGGLLRLFGAVDLDGYFQALRPYETVLTSGPGREVRVTDRLGTDVTFKLAEAPYGKPRRADKPGTYLVPGSCTMFPELESVRGTVCFASIFHEYFTELSEPLTLTVDGRIRSISGGGVDRLLLDRALLRAGGGEYGYLIHFTYGMNPAARRTGRSFIEDSRILGNNAVGMGLPWWMPGGGENHPDAVLSKQSIWIEGREVVKDGLATDPSLLDAAKMLVPLPH
jgi:hypothetical protein